MKKTKKITSLLLIIAMLISLIPNFAFADNTSGGGSTIKRYTVLVLDDSGSMSGAPKSTLQAASKKFVDQVLQANGENYVAIVKFSWNASKLSGFTNDKNKLYNAINRLSAYGSTNLYDGMVKANQTFNLANLPKDAIKNIIVMSDGIPNRGATSQFGPYTSADHRRYTHGNGVHNYAQTLKDKYNITSLGFFHSLKDKNLEFARRVMEGLQNSGYYDVTNLDDLEFAFGEVAKDITESHGNFFYLGDDKDYPAEYYYNDKYFNESSYIYNEHLATMSLCLELASWASAEVPTYANKARNADDLFEELGFSDFMINAGYQQRPTKDSIGAVMAHKAISVDKKDYTLLALAVRGGGYEKEWASNFTIGENGAHDGFDQASDDVLAFIDSYVAQHNINGDIKLWLTGYSRGGGVANLVAGKLDNGATIPNCNLELENIYTYTFEAPAGVLKDNTKDSKYNNIFNTINLNDPVPKVAPNAWDFSRYGIDKRLPSAATLSEKKYADALAKMKEKYNAMPAAKAYIIDDFTMKKVTVGWNGVSIIDDKSVSQDIFLNDYITRLVKELIVSRNNYVATYQTGIRDICSIFLGSKPAEAKRLNDELAKQFKDNFPMLLAKCYFEGKDSCIKAAAKVLENSIKNVGITDYNEKEFKRAVAALANLVIEMGKKHPVLSANLYTNMKSIGQAHDPTICLAWLQSMDSNYTTGAQQNHVVGAYRVIRINCPVDITVYNAEGQPVAGIINDVPQQLTTIISAVNQDGEKLVYLPSSDEYSVKIEATDDGEMDYSITEYNPVSGETDLLINYFDLPLRKGDVYQSLIPKYSDADNQLLLARQLNGSSTPYTLSFNGNVIDPSQKLAGKSASEGYYLVTATSNDENLGIAVGGGLRQAGQYVELEAIAKPNAAFVGWYINDNLVATRNLLRMRVEDDIAIVARFTTGSSHQVSFVDWDDSVLEVQTVTHGAIAVAPPAPTRAGYTFRGWNKSFDNVIDDLWVKALYQRVDADDDDDDDDDDEDDDEVYVIDDNRIALGGLKNGALIESGRALADNFARYNRLPLALKTYQIGAADFTAKGSALQKVEIDLATTEKKPNYGIVLFGEKGQAEVFDGTIVNNKFNVELPRPGIVALYNRADLPKAGKIVFAGKSFADVNAHWAKNVIEDLASRSIINGKTDTVYQPDTAITRAEFIGFVMNYLALPSQPTEYFADVNPDSPHFNAINTARALGIVKGTGENLFEPNKAISRQDLVTILERVLALIGVENLAYDNTISFDNFKDSADIADYAKTAFETMIKCNVINGTPEGTLMPRANTSRAETAQIIINIIHAIK